MLRLLLFLLPLSTSAQVLRYVDSVEVHRTDVIYFDFGSDELTPEARAAIDTLVRDRPGELELYVEGHTDAVGSNRSNEDLARRRGEAAREAVVTAGWPAASVELRHFGEKRLAVRTVRREQLNRRVLLRSGLPRRYAVVRGRILDEEDHPLAGGAVATGKYLSDTVRADAQGYYTVVLPLEEEISLDFYAPGHFFNTKRLSIQKGEAAPDLTVRLLRANEGRIMAVRNLYFVGGKAELLPQSEQVPSKILAFMLWNQNLRIEIGGHINHPGKPQAPGSWSYGLALRRAESVRDYLLANGIAEDRIRHLSYSNFKMVFPEPKNNSEARANRRVEIKILPPLTTDGAD